MENATYIFYKDEDILRKLTQKNPEDLIELKDEHVKHTRFKFNEDNRKFTFKNFDLSVDKLYDNHFKDFYFQLITFRDCSFKGMKFENMFFLGCHFINCNFQDCHLNKVTFNLCSFNNLTNISKTIESVLFNNCTFNSGEFYFDLQNLNFKFSGFKNCTITNVDFSNSTFQECFLNGGEVFKNIDNSIFKNCEFITSTFENLHFTNILFDYTKFIATFQNIVFDGSDVKIKDPSTRESTIRILSGLVYPHGPSTSPGGFSGSHNKFGGPTYIDTTDYYMAKFINCKFPKSIIYL